MGPVGLCVFMIYIKLIVRKMVASNQAKTTHHFHMAWTGGCLGGCSRERVMSQRKSRAVFSDIASKISHIREQ